MAEKTERAHIVRDRSGRAEGLSRPLTEEERARCMPCFVRHPDAGGQCQREAAVMVYGLLFCEVHGAEAAAGALGEFYQDGEDFLEWLLNPHVPATNAEVERKLVAAMRDLGTRGKEHEDAEEAALLRAYPWIQERVDAETLAFDYRFGSGNMYDPWAQPTDAFAEGRRLTHKLMRLAYEASADWMVEVLEYEREGASAQLAFALEDYERKVGRADR